ncbi:carbon-nitrogen hydrolase family protein [Mycolicibacterium sp. CBM1]
MTRTVTAAASDATSRAVPATLNVGVVQMSSRTNAWQANLDDAATHVHALAAKGARVIVLPELFATGYDLDIDMDMVAEEVPGATTDALSAVAKATGTVIATALVTRGDNGALFDSSLVVGPGGVLGLGRKRFLWDRENDVFAPGTASGLVVDTPHGRVGVVICYEAGFPETVRDLATRGAEVIAVPSAFGHVRLHIWKLLTRSRALENGVVVAAAGLTGQTGNGPRFAGHSVIVGPQGRMLVEMDESIGSVCAVVERKSLANARNEVPYLSDLARLGGIAEQSQERI